MPDITITNAGILNLRNTNLDVNMASGPDQVSSTVLNETAESAAPILKTIFMYSMDTGTVPDDWRNANVTLIFKKDNQCQPSNYRPISVTSIVSKIFECIYSLPTSQNIWK